jgi:hypothetical protein
MAINRFLNYTARGEGRGAEPNGNGEGRGAAPTFDRPAPSTQPSVPAVAAAPAQPTAPIGTVFVRPDLSRLSEITPRFPGLTPGLPDITPRLPIPPIVLPPFFKFPKTTTQIAQDAINQLKGANPTVVAEAINTVRHKNISADGMMKYLERKVIIGQVINDYAKDWTDETKHDFAEAFQMAPDRLDVMDSIVSIAILNDPDLRGELQIENTPETTEGDLLENRRIVWQHPPPGTLLQPPYLILLAVEYRNIKRAEDIINSIFGELVDYQGYKIPNSVAQKLRQS